MRRCGRVAVGVLALLAAGGCADDGSRARTIRLQVAAYGTEAADRAQELALPVTAAALTIALYAPDTSPSAADSIHALAQPTANRTGLTGLTVAGPTDGLFTVTLAAGNSLIHGMTGTLTVAFHDEDLERDIAARGEAGLVDAVIVTVALVAPEGVAISGTIEVAAPSGVPLSLVQPALIHAADLAIALPSEEEDAAHEDEDGHGHGHEHDEGHDDDDHGDEEHADDAHALGEYLASPLDVELLDVVWSLDAAAERALGRPSAGSFALGIALRLAEGSRAEGGHSHGGGRTIEVPVSVEAALADAAAVEAFLRGAGLTLPFELELVEVEGGD